MSTDDHYLCGVRAVIVEPGMGKGRARILCRQLQVNGGTVEPSVSDTTTHLLVGNNVRRSRLPVLLGITELPSSVRVVRADWLSLCLIRGERLRESEYVVPETPLPTPSPSSSPQKPPTNSPSTAGREVLSERRKKEEEVNADGKCDEKESEGGGEAGVRDQQCVTERVRLPSQPFPSYIIHVPLV